MIEREIYTMSFNPRRKFADWVAYKVTPQSIGPTQERVWKTDPLVPDEFELEPSDYKGAYRALQTDRGHQVPLASFTNTPYWQDTNYLTNITPQKSNLNRGPWMRLESAVRDLVKTENTVVYVLSGTLYEPNEEQMTLPLADEPHQVPTGYFKIVATANGYLTAFVFDQDTPRSSSRCAAISRVEEVSRRSGYSFFMSGRYQISGSLDEKLGCPQR